MFFVLPSLMKSEKESAVLIINKMNSRFMLLRIQYWQRKMK